MNPSQKLVIQASITVPDDFVATSAHWTAFDNKDISVDITR